MGFPKGASIPLVTSGVQTPLVNSIDCIATQPHPLIVSFRLILGAAAEHDVNTRASGS